MKLNISLILLIIVATTTKCTVTNKTTSNSSLPNSDNTITTSTVNEVTDDKNEWYYIPSGSEHMAINAEKGFGDAIGAEKDLTKIKYVTVSFELDQKNIPKNLGNLINLEKISLSRKTKDKTGANINNQIKMNLAPLLTLNSLKHISLYNLIPEFGVGPATNNLKVLSITSCKLENMPKFIETSSLQEVYIGYCNTKGINIGKLPATITNFTYNGLSDKQEIDIVSQIGLDIMFPNHLNIPKKFVFKMNDHTVDELLANKHKVMSLYLDLNSNTPKYLEVLNSFDNLQRLYINESQTIANKAMVYPYYSFPSEIYKCKNLTFLELNSERIEEINGDLSVLKKLKTLKISAPLTKIVPFKIIGLEELTLDTKFNPCTTAPSPTIDKIYNKKLSADLTGKSQANLDQVLKNHPKLQKLRLMGNSALTKIDAFSISSLNQYTNLKIVEIDMINTREFPMFVLNNLNLELIRFDNLSFNSIPTGIGKLTKLKGFWFSTKATNLPDELFTLPNLTHLSFTGSKINNLDNLFREGTLPKIKQLYVYMTKAPISKLEAFKKAHPSATKIEFR